MLGGGDKISTHLRRAAGVCVLTTGLLIASAGGAIAAADTESTGSTTQSEGAGEASQSGSSASAPTATVAGAPRQSTRPTLRDVIRKLHLLGRPGQQHPVDAAPTTVAVPTGTATDNQESNPTPPTTPAASDSNVVATDSNVVAPDSNVVAPDSNETAPVTNVVASDPNVPASSTDLVVPASAVVQPVTNDVAPATTVESPAPAPVVAPTTSTSTTPVADVITSLQNLLISVNNAVAPLAQVLYSLLGGAAANATEIHAGVGNGAPGLSAAAGSTLAPGFSPLTPPVLPISGIGDVSLFGSVTAPATLGGIATAGLSEKLSPSGTAPLAPKAAGPTTALSLLEHTVSAVLAPASLTALAAIALPGVGGLLIICVAGMQVGYRQAKAALAVRTTGIARFARQGPLGVVRSGSLVALHTRAPRALRVVRPEVSGAAPLLKQVA